MNKKWPTERTFRFIRSYRSHECLWNVCKDIYKDRDMRDVAYDALADEFDISVIDVKTKIKNLRATFFQELKKVNESIHVGCRNEDIYRPNLVWFAEMQGFIRSIPNNGILKNDNLASEFLNESSIEDFVIKEEPLDDFPTESDLVSIPYIPPVVQQSTPISPISKQNNSNNSKEVAQTSTKVSGKRKKSHDPYCNFQILPSSHQIEDEFDAFGRHVACQLRQLSICRSLDVQTKIQFLLSKERAKDIKENGETNGNGIATSPASSLADLEQSSSFDHMSHMLS